MSKRPLILITNDDGIASPGLAATAAALDPLGELLIVAPSNQQTSMSRSRSQNQELNGSLSNYTVVFQKQSWPGFAVNATPALAVEHAIHQIAKRPIDLVVSGINYGENIGTCVTVSGTIGAALEAAENRIPALAISLELAQADYHSYSKVDFSTAIHFTHYFAGKVLDTKLPYDIDLLKIEIPKDANLKTEWLVTKLDRLAYYQTYTDSETITLNQPQKIHHRPLKGQYLEKGTDAYALAQGLVSVTPLSLDLSSRTALNKLFDILK